MRSSLSWRHWSQVDIHAARRDRAQRIALLPWHWSRQMAAEYEKRGGVESLEARAWFVRVTDAARGRLSLAVTDDELRAAAKAAAHDGMSVAGKSGMAGDEVLYGVLEKHVTSWGLEAPKPAKDGDLRPAIRRMLCERWFLRRMRRAHGRRCDGAAIAAGVVRRGLWPYASEDAVTRRTAQRKRNARAIDKAVIECERSGEALPLADVVAGSIANPEVRRAELMVRIRGCDARAADVGAVAEFWTLTAPSAYHAQKITGATSEPNGGYKNLTPRAAQEYLVKVWARARAAWARRGLEIFGLRTAEPHHDGTPHWHVIAYGQRRDLRYARRLLRVYALRESPDEPGARKYRFKAMALKGGQGGARYAAKYISKNIDGGGMDGALDGETGRKIADTVRRVDTWASVWGIRQFQFFGCPQIGIWRALRRIEVETLPRGSMLQRAASAADDSDFADFWRAVVKGGLTIMRETVTRATIYGDAAAKRTIGVAEGARRAVLNLKEWAIRWSGQAQAVGRSAFDLAFDFPRSGVNNCTAPDRYSDAVAAISEFFGESPLTIRNSRSMLRGIP